MPSWLTKGFTIPAAAKATVLALIGAATVIVHIDLGEHTDIVPCDDTRLIPEGFITPDGDTNDETVSIQTELLCAELCTKLGIDTNPSDGSDSRRVGDRNGEHGAD